MFKYLLTFCSLIFFSNGAKWCSGDVYDKVKACLKQPNCNLKTAGNMTPEQLLQTTFRCRFYCGVIADCTRKPWHVFDKKLDLAVWFGKCMKKCNNPYMTHAKYRCSENCWEDFKLMKGYESSESSEENHS